VAMPLSPVRKRGSSAVRKLDKDEPKKTAAGPGENGCVFIGLPKRIAIPTAVYYSRQHESHSMRSVLYC
jgi:hypothetical protein